MTAGPDNVGRLVEQIDIALRARGTPGRAEHEKAYLKSELEHYGTSVPAIRSVAKEVASYHPGLSHDELVALVGGLWAAPVHERRMVAIELLDIYHGRLHREDILLLERLLRESRTWALVDSLTTSGTSLRSDASRGHQAVVRTATCRRPRGQYDSPPTGQSPPSTNGHWPDPLTDRFALRAGRQ